MQANNSKTNSAMYIARQKAYYTVFVETIYQSFEEARTQAPDLLAAHIAQSQELHEQGILLMAGAFLDNPSTPLSTMAILTTREEAEKYIQNDPFVVNGCVRTWSIRVWANIFA